MSLLDALLLDPYRINVWIAYRTDGVKGTGTQNDPYDGSTATKFDAVMNGLFANTRIHFGPGTFQTNGYADGVGGGWQPKAGMKIVGSGVDVTTLQHAATSTNTFFSSRRPSTSTSFRWNTPAVASGLEKCRRQFARASARWAVDTLPSMFWKAPAA